MEIISQEKINYHTVTARDIEWTLLQPNEAGDWINQRSDIFNSLILLGDKKDKENKQTFFEDIYSNGLKTNRDAWCYNFSKEALGENIKQTILFYNEQCTIIKNGGEINYNPTKFSWSDNPKKMVYKDKKFTYEKNNIIPTIYRPFTKENLYFSKELNDRTGQMYQIFPTQQHENKLICIDGLGHKNKFSCLISKQIPDLGFLSACQCFPLYYYKENEQGTLFDDVAPTYTRKDGITDWILQNVRARFSHTKNISKEDIFYYVYGILHSKDYRNKFNDDLKKVLARLPIVDTIEEFKDFSKAGRKLAELHLNYEDIAPYPHVKVIGRESNNFKVEKMRYKSKEDKSIIIYNGSIHIENIPLEAYNYVINGRSAIDWIVERYQIKIDKDSQIKNDPNHWAEEQGKPSYILDLLLSIINVSIQTMDIVDNLPRLQFEE